MGLGLVFTIIVVILDLIISLWNCYAAGFNIGIISKYSKRRRKVNSFLKATIYAGLLLGYVGLAYVFSIIIGFGAYSLGYIDAYTLAGLLSFAFLIFGILIIGLGLLVTIQSVLAAIEKPNIWNILIAIYNVFAESFDIYAYIEGFKDAASIVRREDENTDVYAILIIAVLIAFFVGHAAYKHGYNKAMQQ
jgi:vacuolar-type H+-ATPase subunit I/STV1